jgi:hypothetical protein
MSNIHTMFPLPDGTDEYLSVCQVSPDEACPKTQYFMMIQRRKSDGNPSAM